MCHRQAIRVMDPNELLSLWKISTVLTHLQGSWVTKIGFGQVRLTKRVMLAAERYMLGHGIDRWIQKG
jgi:hypothetical protein